MKKLFTLLLGLSASLGALAYVNPDGFSGVSFKDIGSDTQLIEMSSPNALSAWATDATELGYMGQTNRTKLVITGPMSASDFTALSGDAWKSFTTVDLSKVTVTDPSYISNMNLTNAQTVVLPSGLTKEQVASLKDEAKNVVAGITGETLEQVIPHYFFEVNGKSFEYTGAVEEGQTSVTLTDYPLMANLTLVEDYPMYKYSYAESDREYTITETEYTSHMVAEWASGVYYTDFYSPSELEVKLTQDGEKTSWLYNGSDVGDTNPNIADNVSYDEVTGKYTLTAWVWTSNFGNLQTGWEVTRVSSPKYTYNWLDNNGNTLTLDFTGNSYEIDGSPYGKVSYSSNLFKIRPTSVYKYTYTDINGETQTAEFSAPTEQIQAGSYSGIVGLTNIPETQTEFVVDGMAAYVKTAGTLSSVASTIYDSSVKTQYRGAKNITIMGNINNSDLTELSETNFGSVEYLSMKDAVLDGNITVTTTITENGQEKTVVVPAFNIKGTAAIILPAIKDGTSTRNVSKMELGAIQAQGGWTPVYHCLSYFDKDDATKMYIYAFDAAVAKLGDAVSNNTAITFIPMYNTDGEFAQFMGYQHNSIEAFEPFRQALGELPAISMDLSIVNQWMNPDFTHLDANTHYLTVYGNVNGSYKPQYDFTGLSEESVFDYPSTVWVVSAYRVDEADAFVLDENGNKVQRVDIDGNLVFEEDGVTPKWQRTGGATKIHYAGKFLEATEPTNLIYVRDRSAVTGADDVTSLLDGAKNYFTNEQLYATRQIFIGSYNNNEIAEIDNDIHGNVFDFMTGTNFTTVTVGEGDAAKTLDCIVNLDNDNVKYILLPDNHEADINATSTDNCSFSNCSELLCVGAYNTTTNTLTTWSSAPGNVYAVTSKIRPQKTDRGTGLVCASLNNVVMSGKLNLADISAGTGNGLDHGLEGAVVKNADLSKAYFPNQEDMVFCPQYSDGGASWDKNIETLLLPTDPRQTLIPAHSLHGSANLNELCVPYNYETIGEDAFGLMGAKIITTTDADGNLIIAGRQYKETDAEGNLIDIDGEIIPNKGLNTFSLSSNLKSIGTMAFWTGNKGLRDVYVLATTAPRCAADAFNSENYCGNIGFEGNFKHPITRDNYHNGDDIWYTILHFPSDINVNEAKKYTDITRDYSLIDETSAFDGKGQLKHWPNHSEISRAYDQALSGVIWNDWPYMTEADYQITLGALPAVLEAKGYTEEEAKAYVDHYRKLGYEGSKYELRVTDGGNEDGIGTIPDGTITATYYKELQEGVTPQTCDFYDYIGWHQFVLTDYYRYEEIEVDDTPKNYTKLDYYTLCFPYDLTRQEVIDLIGAPNKNGNTLNGQALTEDAFPEVYTLKSVIRNQQTQHIDLGFSKELMAIAKTGKEITVTNKGWDYNNNLTTNNKKAGNDKAIFLKGGYPYLVRPIVPEGTSFSNLAEYMMSISDLTADDLGYQKVTSGGAYISVPYSSQGVISTDENGDQLKWTDEDGNKQYYYYFFQGTYENEDLPKYAYYLGQKNGKRSFFYDTTGTRKWNRFSAIIGGRCPTDNAITYIGFDHGTSSKTVSTVTILMRNADDSFNPANNDVKVNFTFEGEDGFDETVAIESINGEAVNSAVEGDVYTVTGQFVGKSVNGLSKGLYIVNGKKVMVK